MDDLVSTQPSTVPDPTHRLTNGLVYSKQLEAELREYAKNPPVIVPPNLMLIVYNIAEMGMLCFDWSDLAVLIRKLIVSTVLSFNDKYPDCRPDRPCNQQLHEILDFLGDIEGCPFTLQRICEIILNNSHIRSTYKLLFALERMVTITSTIPRLDQPWLWKPRELPPPSTPADERKAASLHLHQLLYADVGDGTAEPRPLPAEEPVFGLAHDELADSPFSKAFTGPSVDFDML